MLDDAAAQYRDGTVDARGFADFFAPRLQFFLQQLHAHHHIEDDHYFPIFREADARCSAASTCSSATTSAGGVRSGTRSRPPTISCARWTARRTTLRPAAEVYAQSGSSLLRGLIRHLDDEEDLIVPLILDRGELALGVGH